MLGMPINPLIMKYAGRTKVIFFPEAELKESIVRTYSVWPLAAVLHMSVLWYHVLSALLCWCPLDCEAQVIFNCFLYLINVWSPRGYFLGNKLYKYSNKRICSYVEICIFNFTCEKTLYFLQKYWNVFIIHCNSWKIIGYHPLNPFPNL